MSKKVTKEIALAAMAEASKQANVIGEITHQMNLEIAETKAQYADVLAKHQKIYDDSCEKVNQYTLENKEELFSGNSKTCEFGIGKIGLRLSPAKIVTLDGWTIQKVIDKIKKTFTENYTYFIRVSEDIDKTNIKKLSAAELKKVGLAVEQEEKVKIEF